jgi:hypothetical protein
MKNTFLVIVFAFSVFSCRKWVPADKYGGVGLVGNANQIESINEYTLVVTAPLPIYGDSGIVGVRYRDIPIGDTLIFLGEDLENTAPVLYRHTPIWTSGIYIKTRIAKQRKLLRYEIPSYYPLVVNSLNGKFDRQLNTVKSSQAIYGGSSTSGAAIHTGPRGGRYIINSNGNKTYIKSGSSSSRGGGRSKSSYSRKR